MTDSTVGVNVTGGRIEGIVGAHSVVIENLIFNSGAREEPAQAAAAEPIGQSPYPGLAFFGPSETDVFFGRDTAIARLIEAVGKQSFTALMGASGSGKSSVVLAGLAPRLNKAGNWRFSHFRVGTEPESKSNADPAVRPFRALARALVPFYVDSEDDTDRLMNTNKLASRLAQGELALDDVFALSRSRNKGGRILLIADQFEEVFTTIADEAVRTRFIDVLLAGFADPPAGAVPDICLVLTMRADFYGRALRHRPLADALQNHVENLGPMNREELQEAIVRPAQEKGVTFEAGVVETLLDTVQSKPGGLPLLQFALREMWGRQERKKITRKSYDEIGGVEGALAQRAETVFSVLTKGGGDPAMDKAFQRLFTRLVTLGEGQEDTRRVVDRAELGDDVWGLAQRLAGEENRLVVTNASSARETAEVVHEALIRHWPKLVDWINRDRAFQSWLRQIAPGIELWSANPDDDGPLLRGGMLAQATEWLAKRPDDLSAKERGYIEASVALRRKMEGEKEAARQAEIERQRERAEAAGKLADEQRWRARIAIALGGIAFLAAGIAGYFAFEAAAQSASARREAERAQAAETLARDQAGRARAQTRSAQISRALMVAGMSARETEAGRVERGLLLALAVDPGRALRSNLDIISRDDVPTLTIAAERAVYAGVERRRYDFGRDISSVSFSADGRRIVTGSQDQLRLWDAETGQEVRTLAKDHRRVNSAVFSADGRRVVAAFLDWTARIWDAETGQEMRSLEGHGGQVHSAAFSADGRRIVTASNDRTARIWNAETGQQLLELRKHTGDVFSARFSPDGRRVVTASDDRTARIWDAETGNELRVLEEHMAEVRSAVFSPDGRRIVTASYDKTARIWDAETGEELRPIRGHQEHVLSAAFSPDGRRVVTASRDGTARVWDAETVQEVRTLRHQGWVLSAVFSADGQRIETIFSNMTTFDVTARIWDAATGQQTRALQHAEQVNSAAFSADGGRIVTASSDKTARIWNAETGQEVRVLGHQEEVNSAAFSADGRRIVTASSDKTARIWNAETGQEVRVLGHQEAVSSVAFSADGRRIVTATASYGGSPQIWDAETGKKLRQLSGQQDVVVRAAFSADGRRIVTATFDGTARIWDAETGRELRALDGHKGTVFSAVFSADGRRIVTASEDKTARIWDAETGKELRALAHEGRVLGAAFSADGRRVVTASDDKTARIWDAETGQEVHALIGHGKWVLSAAFSADGRHIVTTSDDKTARIWSVLPSVPEAWRFAGELKHRNLTASEKQEFYLND